MMSELKQRTAAFLYTERQKLLDQLEEVDLLLSLLDEEPPPVLVGEAEMNPRVAEKAIKSARRPSVQAGKTKAEEAARVAQVRRTLLEQLGRNGGSTVQELEKSTGLTHNTVDRWTRVLMREGRLDRHRRPKPKGKQGGGQAPWVYTLAPLPQEEHHLDEESNVVLD
jgi:hypothetical protein